MSVRERNLSSEDGAQWTKTTGWKPILHCAPACRAMSQSYPGAPLGPEGKAGSLTYWPFGSTDKVFR
jgi:hypothetical protein